jgi:hypothetical protein
MVLQFQRVFGDFEHGPNAIRVRRFAGVLLGYTHLGGFHG